MHMIRMVPPPPHFEKEKTLFAGLHIIWISQKQVMSDSVAELKKKYMDINIFAVNYNFQ